MSAADTPWPSGLVQGVEQLDLRDLTFARTRLVLARALVLFCFVWPFFNYRLLDPDGTVELNFLPVFLAVMLVPGIALRRKWSLILAAPVLLAATLFANPTAPLRLAMGIIPLHFIFNLMREFSARGEYLVPPNLAYRSLQLFVLFCLAQTIHLNYFPVFPAWMVNAFVTFIPRYLEEAYDSFGVRGVQGWASEPSGAALTCLSFAMVALVTRPDRKWRVLALLVALTLLNKSIYSLFLTAMFSFGCIITLKRKSVALISVIPISMAFAYYVGRSGRVDELAGNIAVSGFDPGVNNEFFRFAQMLYPLSQFPHVYKTIPMIVNGYVFNVEPLGLLPLAAGYGGFIGLVWLIYFCFRNFRSVQHGQRFFVFIAALCVLLLGPSDMIPCVVSLAMVVGYPLSAWHATPAVQGGLDGIQVL